jgi:hypothetical protein
MTQKMTYRSDLDPPPAFDPAPYPRTYQSSLPWMCVLLRSDALQIAWYQLDTCS